MLFIAYFPYLALSLLAKPHPFDSVPTHSDEDEARVRAMKNWSISLSNSSREIFSSQEHYVTCIKDFMDDPVSALNDASLQKFAKITPQYPGIRAPLPQTVALEWLEMLSPMLNESFGKAEYGWEIQAWYSLVTAKPHELIPLQRFPHVDGINPRQLAMMLYLHETDHGGTAFFRHRSTGLEALTDETFPTYRTALEREVQQAGLPPAAYVTDGAPLFERTYASEGAFNQAIFYPGNLLHSGIINSDAPLSADPRKGRLTINAFFRPKEPDTRAS
jgi:hypothetical protein